MNDVTERDNIPIIEVKDLRKTFYIGRMKVDALAGVSFKIKKGEFVALKGASGAGKSTLLHQLGGLERSSAGAITINGKEISNMGEDELTLFRKENIGFVFQFFNLIPSLTSLENVMVSHMFEAAVADETWDYAVELLDIMGLKKRHDHKPTELSGGEQQRVAIARALLNKPRILLADEPTGNIDTDSGHRIMRQFSELNKRGTTIIIATHNDDIAKYAHRIITLKDGKILISK
jgi:putative ABC transport system ATP-binding protein